MPESVISYFLSESADADIKLLVEAFQLPENPLHEGDKYGEAVFDVFPRKGTLFSALRQKTPSSRDAQELYQFETNMTLSQVVTNEGFSANAGVIRAAVSLKQDQPKQEGEIYICTLLEALLAGGGGTYRKIPKISPSMYKPPNS